MKTLFVASLLILGVFSNRLRGLPVRVVSRVNSLRGICVKADDLVCPRDDITFWLYTRSTQDNPVQLDINSLDQAPWVDGPLKFHVHGYSVHKDTADNAVLRQAYFSVGEYNIISVDWSPLGQSGCYAQAVQNVPTIAKCVADFFNAVTKARKFSEVHLLGHSMGAHVAARASTHIPDLPRLTKFDVANPLFDDNNSVNGSAGFIDVYHSNSGLKGQRQASGDVDVYFNNDSIQPGCKCDTSCSHLRAVQYYAETIGASIKMKAFPCGGWQDYSGGKCAVPAAEDLVVVGEDADTSVRGSFMAFTAPEEPFLRGDDMYTDEDTFNSFKRSMASECLAHYTYRRLIGDWTN